MRFLHSIFTMLLPVMLVAQVPDISLLGDGYMNLDIGQYDAGHSILPTENAIYLTGTTTDDQGNVQLVILARQPNGSPMPTFGTNGQLVIDQPGYTWVGTRMKAASGNSSILAAARSGSSGQDIVLFRINGAGVIDPAFGQGGSVIIDRGQFDLLYDVLVQSDGRIAVLTYAPGVGGAVIKVEANGAAVSGFGVNGTANLPLGVLALTLAPAPGDGMSIGGNQWTGSQNDCWMALLNGAGSFNNTFSGDGQTTFDLDPHLFDQTSDIITSLAPHPAGGHLALVNIYGDAIGYGLYRIARLNAQGQLIPSFGGGGAVEVLSPNFNNRLPTLMLEPDGRSVLSVGTNTALVLEKRDSNGQLINSWGNNGIATISVVGRTQYSMSEAVQDPQGRIIAIGSAYVASDYIIAVDRVTNDLQTAIEPLDNGTLGLVAYPVPCQTQLTLRAEEPLRRVDVMDMGGRLVQSSQPGTTQAHLDLSEAEAGVYLVHAYGEHTFATRMVIKQ